jgi:hypothetical protein
LTGVFGCSEESPHQYLSGRTLDDLYRSNPEIFSKFFDSLNFDYPGLDRVKQAVQAGEMVNAARLYLGHHRNGSHCAEFRLETPVISSDTDGSAERTLAYEFAVKDDRRILKQLPNGLHDWLPDWPDYSNFRGLLIRHQELVGVLNAWQETGNPRYAVGFDQLIMDWMLFDERWGDRRSPTGGIDLELSRGIRLDSTWPRLFFGFQQAPEFNEVTRFLMVRSILNQARNSYRNPGETRYLNIRVEIQMGIFATAVYFPEFEESELWAEESSKNIVRMYREGVLADGMLSEMATRYACNFAEQCGWFMGMADRAGIDLGNSFRTFVESQWNIHFYLMQPNGDAANFGDSYVFPLEEYFTANNGALWNKFPREDWRYIASNGISGEKPAGHSSRIYSVSGQVVMRNGWSADAHWSLFDLGPQGSSGHGHQDKLSLQVANGRPILTDSGKPFYDNNEGAPWLRYFRGSAGHNVLLFDGRGQAMHESSAPADLVKGLDYTVNDSAVYARGTVNRFAKLKFSETSDLLPTSVLQGAAHAREVIYLRDKYWLVIDYVAPDSFRNVEALWHFDGNCTPVIQGVTVSTVDLDVGNLTIVPLGDSQWDVEIVKGQTEPVIQGWHRSDRGERENRYGGNPVPVAVYKAPAGPKKFAWLLYPWRGQQPEIQIENFDLRNGGVNLKMTVDGVPDELRFSATEVVSPVSLGAFNIPGNNNMNGGAVISDASSNGFNLSYATAQKDSRTITEASVGDRLLDEGEAAVFSFTFDSSKISAIASGFGWGFDFGNSVVICTADTGDPEYTFLQHRFEDTSGYPFINAQQAGTWSVKSGDVPPDRKAALKSGNSVTIVTTIKRLAGGQYEMTTEWGGEIYNSSFTFAGDHSIDSVFIRSGARENASFGKGDGYSISDVSLEMICHRLQPDI